MKDKRMTVIETQQGIHNSKTTCTGFNVEQVIVKSPNGKKWEIVLDKDQNIQVREIES